MVNNIILTSDNIQSIRLLWANKDYSYVPFGPQTPHTQASNSNTNKPTKVSITWDNTSGYDQLGFQIPYNSSLLVGRKFNIILEQVTIGTPIDPSKSSSSTPPNYYTPINSKATYTFDVIYSPPTITSSDPSNYNNAHGNLLRILGSGFAQNISPYNLIVRLQDNMGNNYDINNIHIVNDNEIGCDVSLSFNGRPIPINGTVLKVLVVNSQFQLFNISPNTYTIN